MMDNRVEGLAQAIFAARNCGKSPVGYYAQKQWAELSDEARGYWRFYANAALAYLASLEADEPTPEMIEAGVKAATDLFWDDVPDEDVAAIYRAMVKQRDA
jgi:hypothetical protein